jgi:outer membrane protein assembly factor BamB
MSAALAGFLAIALASPFASGKRPALADVPPVVSGNVRYEVPNYNNPCSQNGGCVVAYNNTTNALLWSVEVYCTHYDSSLEEDVQDIFITSLTVEGGQVLVANEKGLHFAIDPTTQQVTGDARGCDKAAGGGCSYLPEGPRSTTGRMVGFLGILAVAGILRRRMAVTRASRR